MSDYDSINLWINQCLSMVGDFVKKSISVKWSFSNRRTKCAGVAKWCGERIELSAKVWKFLSIEQRKELVFHEVCHIIDIWCDANNCYKMDRTNGCHGSTWLALMEKCGYPNANVKIELPGVRPSDLRKPVRVDQFTCGCTVVNVKAHTSTKIKNGKIAYLCKRCGGEFKPAASQRTTTVGQNNSYA